MSWPYWGIVIGLAALIVMLIACIRLLSFDRNQNLQSLGKGDGGSVDSDPERPITHKRAA